MRWRRNLNIWTQIILNLYAMILKLPTHECVQKKSVDNFRSEGIDKLVKKDKQGYILQLDVECSKTLHKKHKELPFQRRLKKWIN